MLRSNADMEVSIFEVNDWKPVPISQHLDSTILGDHPEALGCNLGIQGTEVQDWAKAFILLWNNKVAGEKTTCKVQVVNLGNGKCYLLKQGSHFFLQQWGGGSVPK